MTEPISNDDLARIGATFVNGCKELAVAMAAYVAVLPQRRAENTPRETSDEPEYWRGYDPAWNSGDTSNENVGRDGA